MSPRYMRGEEARRTPAAALLLALTLASGTFPACKPSTAAGVDAGKTARGGPSGDAGAGEGGVALATAAAGGAAPDASAVDDGALPTATSDELTLRAGHLFEAIVQDNPDLGSDLLFPRDAFVSAHDSNDPGRVWDSKVAPAFRRSVHSLHKRTKGIERARFVSFEIGRTVTQATPKRHEWKEPLWHVHHGRINFVLEGKALHFDVAEVTGWRGAWYVSRLR